MTAQLKPLNHSTTTFHGIKTDRHICVYRDEKFTLVKGKLFELQETKDDNGKIKLVRKQVSTTPGYAENATGDESFIAVCKLTGKRYRVVGLVGDKLLNPKSASSSGSKPLEAATSPQQSQIAVKQRRDEKYKRVLDQIVAQRNAGLDPQIRMSFITNFVSESRASLYRKLGTSFPLPVKRGRSSFWTMSSIEAYKAGGL